MTRFISLSIFAYLLGSVPFGFLIGKLKGVDVRKVGSRSTTSTNVARALGWRWGVISATLDFSKGLIPVILAKVYLISPWQIIFIALLPTFGHVLPVWLKFTPLEKPAPVLSIRKKIWNFLTRFRGGKGASTFYASTLVLIGPQYFLPLLPILILILLLSKTMSMGNILFPWVLVIFISLFFSLPYQVFSFLGATFLLFAFRENIKRIKEGVEPQISLRW